MIWYWKWKIPSGLNLYSFFIQIGSVRSKQAEPWRVSAARGVCVKGASSKCERKKNCLWLQLFIVLLWVPFCSPISPLFCAFIELTWFSLSLSRSPPSSSRRPSSSSSASGLLLIQPHKLIVCGNNTEMRNVGTKNTIKKKKNKYLLWTDKLFASACVSSLQPFFPRAALSFSSVLRGGQYTLHLLFEINRPSSSFRPNNKDEVARCHTITHSPPHLSLSLSLA